MKTLSKQMTLIRLSQVPKYLQCGSFYQSLDLSSDDEIQVPEDVTKPNANIWVDSQLVDYLRSLRFWGVSDVSSECTEFVLLRDQHCVSALDEFNATFPTLTLLIELLRMPNKDTRMNTAIERNSLVVVQGMLAVGYDLIGSACATAAQLPTSEVLEYLHSKKGAVSFATVKIALSIGNIEAVRYLELQGLGIKDHHTDVETVEASGYRGVVVGNLACFIHALQRGCTMSAITQERFAANNKLDILQYAHEHGCPWDENTTIAAATHGALSCLKYAYEHGCPTTTRAYTAAYRHRACCAYLAEKGFSS